MRGRKGDKEVHSKRKYETRGGRTKEKGRRRKKNGEGEILEERWRGAVLGENSEIVAKEARMRGG